MTNPTTSLTDTIKAVAQLADQPSPWGGEFGAGWDHAMDEIRTALGRAPRAYRNLGHPDWIDQLDKD